LALIGFGVKAGFFPAHFWLPHAHPAAPAHISALLSGVAIKTGIYGICRVVWMLGELPSWCGYLLLAMGIVSGVMGVLYALGQHELKKLLAYHSIENIGIIAVGLGLGLLGVSYQQPFLAVIGFAGGLLHVLNHSLFKGLLFLGAGAVIQKTHTGEMDHLGGLAKQMPVTSSVFLIGALSICGLPLFNGFISEFIIYFGLLQGLFVLPLPGVVACALGILALALMGALALACFTKVYGTVFSGEPRALIREEGAGNITAKNLLAEEVSVWMLAPMLVLASVCIGIGIAPQSITGIIFRSGEYLARSMSVPAGLDKIAAALSVVIGMALLFLTLILTLGLLRRLFLGRAPARIVGTWNCGFTQVSPRFQYTSSSFARPIVEGVKNILLFRQHGGQISGDFPAKTRLSSGVRDVFEEKLLRPWFGALVMASRRMDDNRIRYTQMYLLYIFLFLIFLLVWKMR